MENTSCTQNFWTTIRMDSMLAKMVFGLPFRSTSSRRRDAKDQKYFLLFFLLLKYTLSDNSAYIQYFKKRIERMPLIQWHWWALSHIRKMYVVPTAWHAAAFIHNNVCKTHLFLLCFRLLAVVHNFTCVFTLACCAGRAKTQFRIQHICVYIIQRWVTFFFPELLVRVCRPRFSLHRTLLRHRRHSTQKKRNTRMMETNTVTRWSRNKNNKMKLSCFVDWVLFVVNSMNNFDIDRNGDERHADVYICSHIPSSAKIYVRFIHVSHFRH